MLQENLFKSFTTSKLIVIEMIYFCLENIINQMKRCIHFLITCLFIITEMIYFKKVFDIWVWKLKTGHIFYINSHICFNSSITYDFLCIIYRLHFTFMKQCSKFTTMEFFYFYLKKNVLLWTKRCVHFLAIWFFITTEMVYLKIFMICEY